MAFYRTLVLGHFSSDRKCQIRIPVTEITQGFGEGIPLGFGSEAYSLLTIHGT